MPFKKSVILSTDPLNARQRADKTGRYLDYAQCLKSTMNASARKQIKPEVITHLRSNGGGIFNIPLDMKEFTLLIEAIGYPNISFCLFGDKVIRLHQYLRSDWIDEVRSNLAMNDKWEMLYGQQGYLTCMNLEYKKSLDEYKGKEK